ncbi:hypothetical protein BB558_002736 [Smittium angustum]|uniref:Uncharacterized protein n=1 Tax=Smittium angustum TaxID=133377 RepID=A0A2U1J7W6_SMIAN|nr:hypothetical protein BB558_002736 [Smittium angustum]
MSWLNYVILPEKINKDFGDKKLGIGKKHIKYSEACELLQHLVSAHNFGEIVINKDFQSKKASQNITQSIEVSSLKNNEYTFGPSTPQSPGYYSGYASDDFDEQENQSTLVSDNEAQIKNLTNPKEPLESPTGVESKKEDTLNPKNSFYSAQSLNSPTYQFSAFERNKYTGLPLLNLEEILYVDSLHDINSWKQCLRILQVVLNLITTVQITETDIEANVHSAFRYMIFIYLVQNSSKESSDLNICHLNPLNPDQTKTQIKPSESHYSSNNFKDSEVGSISSLEYVELMYHRWIVRSYYREKLAIFDSNKYYNSINVDNDGDIEVHFTYVYNFIERVSFLLEKEQACEIDFLGSIEIAACYYDLARFRFAQSVYSEAQNLFKKALSLDISLFNVQGKSMTRIFGDETTALEYFEICEKINIQKTNTENLLDKSSQFDLTKVSATAIPKANKYISQRSSYSNNLLAKNLPEKHNTGMLKSDFSLFEKDNFTCEVNGNNYKGILPLPSLEISWSLIDKLSHCRTENFLSGIESLDTMKISQYTWVSSLYILGMRLLEEDRFSEASAFLNLALNPIDSNGKRNYPEFVNLVSTSGNNPETSLDTVRALAMTYMHISNALQKLSEIDSSTEPNYNAKINEEIGNDIRSAFNTECASVNTISGQLNFVPIKFSFIERLVLACMRLELQELFVFIVERVALHPQLYQQNPEMNMSMLNIASGLYFLKTQLVQSRILNIPKILDSELVYNSVYQEMDISSTNANVISEIRGHYQRVLDSLLLMLTENKFYIREFEKFCRNLNDTNICFMLSGMLIGTLWSILGREGLGNIKSLNSHGNLTLFSLCEDILKQGSGFDFIVPNTLSLFLKNNPPPTPIRQTRNLDQTDSDLDETARNRNQLNKTVDSNIGGPNLYQKKSRLSAQNLLVAKQTKILIDVILILNSFILLQHPDCIPTLLSSYDMLLLKSEKFYKKQGTSELSNLNKGFNFKKTPTDENASLSSQRSGINFNGKSNSIQRDFDFNTCNVTVGVRFGITNSNIGQNTDIYAFSAGKKLLEYIFIATNGFEPACLFTVLAKNFESEINQHLEIDFNNFICSGTHQNAISVSGRSLLDYCIDFYKKNEIKLLMIRQRINIYVSFLIKNQLYLCAAAVLQFPIEAFASIKPDNKQNKPNYTKIFELVALGIDAGQINKETSLFFWNPAVCQHAQYLLSSKTKQSKKSKNENSFNISEDVYSDDSDVDSQSTVLSNKTNPFINKIIVETGNSYDDNDNFSFFETQIRMSASESFQHKLISLQKLFMYLMTL